MSGPTVLEGLHETLKRASVYNQDDQARPAAIIWTDKQRQWESLMPKVSAETEVLTLGAYDPEERTGPSYWIRCMLARTIDDDLMPEESIPIVYLPGYSREDLRAVEDCPKELQPLAELQYRGVWWSQTNSKDWTLLAFLKNQEVGLGLDISSDQATINALQGAIVELASELIDRLRQVGQINATDLHAILQPDPEKSVLLWMDEPAHFEERMDKASWAAFRETCEAKFGFSPEKDSRITAATHLGAQGGEWRQVWKRFAEAPENYPQLPDVLRAARPSEFFVAHPESWPQDNEDSEMKLRAALESLDDKHLDTVRKDVDALWAEHKARRESVWARLGQAPLVIALEWLRELTVSVSPLAGTTTVGSVTAYAEGGWKADEAALKALAAVQKAEDVIAVKSVLTSVYRPWLESVALAFQDKVTDSSEQYPRSELPEVVPGTCVLFSDALRFDLGKQLESILNQEGCSSEVFSTLAALPTVTPTAKPALSPIANALVGSRGFSPSKSKGGPPLSSETFVSALSEEGYQVLKGFETGDPSGKAWTEIGSIDVYGHNNQWKLARRVGEELRAIADRIKTLLEAGWEQVRVVTDHGWLLIPGGLPKVELPEHLTESRKGRCARLKPGVTVDYQRVKWHWDPAVEIAIAPGISSFVAGKEYDHGGISPQECVVPMITVALRAARKPVGIEEHDWVGLRCRVRLSGEFEGCLVDIRSKSADSRSSLVDRPKQPGHDGTLSLLIPDDRHEGEAAFVVVLSGDRVVAEVTTSIGSHK